MNKGRPIITLIGRPEDTFILNVGKYSIRFAGGQPKPVPVAVALAAKRKKTPDGSPVFIVEEMPDIVEQNANVCKEIHIEGYQAKFDKWH